MKFTSEPIAEHVEVPLADEGHLEDVVGHWMHREAPARPRPREGNACYVVSIQEVVTPRADARLAEMLGLVQGQGDRVAGQEIVRLRAPTPRTYLGPGLARDLASRAEAAGADLLVLDAELTPSQTRNLEDVTGMPIGDREAVILNVFRRSARTRAAQLQVELAHLQYLRPRIRGMGLDMDQQAGGALHSRGPGETGSELLARQLDGRLLEIQRALARLRRSGESQRQHRAESRRIALVGYTNAGKTSLMNALTGAGLSVRDRPFETLDTTSRSLTRHGGDVLLCDTVGFIRRLPERLLAAFESTLAEVREASLLAVVVDVSDPEWDLHLATTEGLLERLGARDLPRFHVFTKIDRLPSPLDAARLAEVARGGPFLALCTHDAAEVARLGRRLVECVRSDRRVVELCVPYAASRVTSAIYARCRVLGSIATETGLRLTVEAEPRTLAELQAALEGVTP